MRVCALLTIGLPLKSCASFLECAQDDVADGEAGWAHALRHQKSLVLCWFAAIKSDELVFATRIDELL